MHSERPRPLEELGLPSPEIERLREMGVSCCEQAYELLLHSPATDEEHPLDAQQRERLLQALDTVLPAELRQRIVEEIRIARELLEDRPMGVVSPDRPDAEPRFEEDDS